MIRNDDWMNPNYSDRMLAMIEYLEATVKRLKKMADVAELAAATNAERIRDLEAENARLRAALKPVLECDVTFRSGEEPWSVINGREIKTEAGPRIATAVNHECAIGIAECHNAIYEACGVLGFFEEEESK